MFKLSRRPRIIRVVFSSVLDLCAICHRFLLASILPIIAFAFTLALLDAAPNPFIALPNTEKLW